jgi:hypothetical protein
MAINHLQELESSATNQEIIDKINEIVRAMNLDLWGSSS